MHRRALAVICALLVALTGTSAQTCDATVQLEDDDLVISPTGTTCIQCIILGMVQTTVQWSVLGTSLVDGTNGINIVNGVLVVNDVDMFVTAYEGIPLELRCDAAGSNRREELYLEGLFAPIVTAQNNGIVVEGDSITLFCTNNNAPDTTRLEWVGPNPDREIPLFANPPLMNVLRDDAGTYECILRSVTNNSLFISASVDVTVHYPPTVMSDDTSPVFVPLDGRLTLSCTYDSVPDSTVTWFQNGNMITSGVDGYILSNNAPIAVLTLTDVNRDSGGMYSCTADNTIGTPDTDSVNVTVQVPPDPATNLNVSNEQETSIDLTWMNNFDGFSPITGVTITPTRMGEAPDPAIMIDGDASLQSATITDLIPFAMYTFELTVNNSVGPSDPVSVTGMTMSLRLTAPLMVTLTSPSSTSLLLDWEPPAPLPTTEAPQSWMIELFDSDGVGIKSQMEQDPSITQFTFNDLAKGVNFSARVAGLNVRGVGDYSDNVTNLTLVDPPSMPINLTGEGVSAFGFELSWEPPADNGGRPVTEYIASYRTGGGDFYNVSTMTELELLLRNGGDITPPVDLINSTTYDILVRAVNEAGMGDPATITVTTQSIEEPQRIFERPESSGETNLSAVITWENPGGQVIQFRVEVKLRSADWSNSADVMVFNVTGNMTSLQVQRLQPEANYDVRVRAENALGVAEFSIEATFSTLPPSPPTVSGPTVAQEGERVQINCSSSVDTLTIMWFRIGADSDGMDTFTPIPPRAMMDGNDLVFMAPTTMDTGRYVCRLGNTVTTEHTIEFKALPTEAPGLSTEIIIIVSVIGGVAVLVFLVVLFVACYCTCFSSAFKKTSSYSVKSKSQGKSKAKGGKKSMTWIETSTKFVPNTNPNYSRDPTEPSPFDMPDDMTTHSSFNTLEKQNRIRQSEAPPPSYGNSNV